MIKSMNLGGNDPEPDCIEVEFVPAAGHPAKDRRPCCLEEGRLRMWPSTSFSITAEMWTRCVPSPTYRTRDKMTIREMHVQPRVVHSRGRCGANLPPKARGWPKIAIIGVLRDPGAMLTLN